MSDDLFEHETEATMTREQAAARLRALADALERQNSLRVVQDGRDVTISVPDTVEYELEVDQLVTRSRGQAGSRTQTGRRAQIDERGEGP